MPCNHSDKRRYFAWVKMLPQSSLRTWWSERSYGLFKNELSCQLKAKWIPWSNNGKTFDGITRWNINYFIYILVLREAWVCFFVVRSFVVVRTDLGICDAARTHRIIHLEAARFCYETYIVLNFTKGWIYYQIFSKILEIWILRDFLKECHFSRILKNIC